jgi:signal transduction histidine kinase
MIKAMKRFPVLPPYERGIYIFLSTFRFLAFALAIALIFVAPGVPVDAEMYLFIGLLGIYTILKILFPFRLFQRGFTTYAVLGGDLVVCLALVLLTGGAESPFLLYSLLPTIVAAFFFQPRVALIIASLSSMSLIVAHVGLSHLIPYFAPVLAEGLLTIMIMYVIFCFLLATITYRVNLNLYRHIESAAILEERRRLRQETHDNIAQVLAYLGTRTQLIKRSLPFSEDKLFAELDEIHRVMADSYSDIRESIDFLATEAEPVSLVSSLARHVAEFGRRTGIETKFAAPKELPGPLHPTAQLQLLRIAQEALNNVRKHASAGKVWVNIENTAEGLLLTVKDNGRGFSPSEQRGAGLDIMKERAESIGGTLEVRSSREEGTAVRVQVPWKGSR